MKQHLRFRNGKNRIADHRRRAFRAVASRVVFDEITSIAVRNLDSGQTRPFSIHLIAERRGLLEDIERHYDALEREMLVGRLVSRLVA